MTGKEFKKTIYWKIGAGFVILLCLVIDVASILLIINNFPILKPWQIVLAIIAILKITINNLKEAYDTLYDPNNKVDKMLDLDNKEE